MSDIFKLRECIEAHDIDVKSLFSLPDGYGFISASRDLSVRLWKEECDTFKEEKRYLVHTSYISTVIYMNPSLNYSDGIIFSSGYDKIIYGFSPLTCNIEFTLKGHSDTVTSLSIKGMELASGSMDKTAIIWNLSSNSISAVFKGHSHGIWSLILLQSINNGLLTASADKDIFLWNTKTKTRTITFSGHTDCVRCIVEIPEREQFLSCSNDATIRLWSLNASTSIREFHAHSAYIYSMAVMPEDDTFVSCGEDGMACVWDVNNASRPLQTIVHHAQSIWCVSILNNGDIVTGASDGRIRLFSKNPNFQNGIEPAAVAQKQIITDSVVDKLPPVGIEMLSLPGSYDGQLMKVIDDGEKVLYSWSVIKETWVKESFTVTSSSNKKTHDYIFSIDIKDGEPALKLPYNIGQDPWTVAHKFLEDNDLSPMFLEQVANFIINNTPKSAGAVLPETTFSDPFTGSNRYIPPAAAAPQVISTVKMFPQKSFLKFDQINAAGLSKKMSEICGSNIVPAEILALVEKIHNLLSDEALKLSKWTINEVPGWETGSLFPLIDILRMLVRDPQSHDVCLATPDLLTKVLSRTLLSKSEPCTKANTLTVVKLMVNAFCHHGGQNLMYNMATEMGVCLLQSIVAHDDKHVMNAIASWFLNMSVLINDRYNEAARVDLLKLCFDVLDTITPRKDCTESVHRLLVTIGTLVCNSGSFTFRENLTVGIFDKINTVTKLYLEKMKWGAEVAECSGQLAQLVSSLDLFNF